MQYTEKPGWDGGAGGGVEKRVRGQEKTDKESEDIFSDESCPGVDIRQPALKGRIAVVAGCLVGGCLRLSNNAHFITGHGQSATGVEGKTKKETLSRSRGDLKEFMSMRHNYGGMYAMYYDVKLNI